MFTSLRRLLLRRFSLRYRESTTVSWYGVKTSQMNIKEGKIERKDKKLKITPILFLLNNTHYTQNTHTFIYKILLPIRCFDYVKLLYLLMLLNNLTKNVIFSHYNLLEPGCWLCTFCDSCRVSVWNNCYQYWQLLLSQTVPGVFRHRQWRFWMKA